jgi:hypothetical protein
MTPNALCRIIKSEIDKMKEINKWLEQFRKIWEDRFNQLDSLLFKIKNKTK